MQYKRFILTLLLVFLFRPISLVQSQTAVENIIITAVNTDDFPQVVIRFRSLDRLNVPVSDLTLNGVIVSENGEEVAPESITEVEEGIWIHFVVDAGAGLTNDRWGNAREAILDFVQTTPWMKENLDRVAVTVVEAGGVRPLIDFTGDGDSIATVLEGYSPPGGTSLSNPLPQVSTMLDEMDLIDEAKNQAKFVVFFTPALERGGSSQIEGLIEKSAEYDIPIYSVMVRESLRTSDQNVLDLGDKAGGIGIHYQDSNSMTDAYRQMSQHRRQYDLSYRSTSGATGTRQVEIKAEVGDVGLVNDSTSYTVEVNQPRVLIETPGMGEVITREAVDFTEDRGSIQPTTYAVIANVVFADGHLRRLRRATLLVNGAEEGNVPNPSDNIELSWNLRDIQELGVNDFSLQVEVEDELGLVSTSPPVTTKVEVIIPPRPTPNPEPTIDVAILTEEITEKLEAELALPIIECVLPWAWVCENIERPVRRNVISVMSITISVIFAGIVWFKRDSAPVMAARERVTSFVDTITKRVQRAEAKAYLLVLEGDVNVGKSLEIFGDTPIGRSRQNAELLFQQYDDNSPISRLHCTIMDEGDHFTIKDEDSANGTYVNGGKLTPLEVEMLRDGDEIELARVERGGVRVLFQLAQDEGEMGEGLRETRRTLSPNLSNGNNEQDPF